MTNLRKRLDNVIAELEIIREGLKAPGRYPTCCLTIRKNGEISCTVQGPLPEKEFLDGCEKCKAEIKQIVERIHL